VKIAELINEELSSTEVTNLARWTNFLASVDEHALWRFDELADRLRGGAAEFKELARTNPEITNNIFKFTLKWVKQFLVQIGSAGDGHPWNDVDKMRLHGVDLVLFLDWLSKNDLAQADHIASAKKSVAIGINRLKEMSAAG